MINIKYILGTQSERLDCEKNCMMSNWSDRFMKKLFPFHEMVNFTKWLRNI
jgi:hypothetical protein